MVDLGVRFHIMIKLNDRHTAACGDGADDGAGAVILGTELTDEDVGDGAFTASEVPGQRNLNVHTKLHYVNICPL